MSRRRLFVFLLGAVLFAAPFIGIPRFVKINSVYCKSQYGPCNFNLQKSLDQFQTKSLSDSRKGLENLLETDDSIDEYTIHFKLPDRLEVNVLEKKAFIALKNENSDLAILVDKDGYGISFQENTSLPLVTTYKDLPDVGESVDKRTLFAMNLMSDLFVLYGVRTGEMLPDGLVVDLTSGERVIFPLEGDKQILSASLTVILNKLKQGGDDTRIELGSVREIDLRFKNPVLR